MNRVTSICAIVALLLFVSGGSAVAQIPGDCDGNGMVNTLDITFMVSHLFAGGPGPAPVNRPNCDCDNNPGFTYADPIWLSENLFIGSVPLYFASGTSLTQSSQSMFYSNLRADGIIGRNRIDLMIGVHPAETIQGFYIPFSFDSGPGFADISVVSVSMVGSVVPSAIVTWDNVAKIIYLHLDPRTSPIVPGGTAGLVATVTFTQNVPGAPVFLTKESTSIHTPIIFPAGWIVPGGAQIMTPAYIEKAVGEGTGDRFVDIDDAVALINYIFSSIPLVYWP